MVIQSLLKNDGSTYSLCCADVKILLKNGGIFLMWSATYYCALILYHE
jgi:hypothetical protein